MKIKFGEKSIENYKEGLSIIDCIPKEDDHNWVEINTETKWIEVELK